MFVMNLTQKFVDASYEPGREKTCIKPMLASKRQITDKMTQQLSMQSDHKLNCSFSRKYCMSEICWFLKYSS